MNETERFGESLREARELGGLSQQYVANQIGIRRENISNWETGGCRPSKANYVKLTKILPVRELSSFFVEKSPVGNPQKPEPMITKICTECRVVGGLPANRARTSGNFRTIVGRCVSKCRRCEAKLNSRRHKVSA